MTRQEEEVAELVVMVEELEAHAELEAAAVVVVAVEIEGPATQPPNLMTMISRHLSRLQHKRLWKPVIKAGLYLSSK